MNLITHIIKLRTLSSITHSQLHFIHTSSFLDTNYDKSPHQFSSKTQSFNLVSPNNMINNKTYDVIYCNKLITKYIRSGDLESAIKLFNEMPIKSIITWNSILAGFSRKPGTLVNARQVFDEMPERDLFSYNTMLSCYMRNNDVYGAKILFEQMPVKDVASWNTMVSGFAGNGKMEEAEKLFWMIPVRNSVSWNAMISGYVEFGDLGSALKLFELDPFKTVVAWTAIVTGYMKIGDVEMAEKMYAEMPLKSCVTWNTMIAGYVENARPDDAVKLFKMMVESGVKPTPLTLTSTLLACSNLSALVFGKQIHQFVYKSPLYRDTPVGTSLLSMYCKCGVLQDAWKLFMEMPRRDIVTWNSMISGYATHGDKETALALFDKMRNEKMKPDWITYVAVLSACNHAGLVHLGMRYFESMRVDYGIEAKPEHYSCMVDLLGRAGQLKEAMDLIENMPFKPHAAIFGSLLGASRMHKNIEVAEYAANNLISIDPTNAAAYVQLANVYATRGKWDHVSRIWRSMKDNKVVKTPGYSWIEIQNVIHEFRSSDREHPELPSIHKKISELQSKMKLIGYVPNLEYALHDVEDDQKEKLLLWHSEKLAIAYGLIKVPKGLPIRIFKNLRVCGDCHRAIKYISSIEGREIIVRDSTRFHHFKDGSCSCGDYW